MTEIKAYLQNEGNLICEVRVHELISYTLGDGRKVEISFIPQAHDTKVIEVFEPETMNPIEMQQEGWQSILNSFKQYVEQR